MMFSSESHFEIKYLPKTTPARKHFWWVAKKLDLAHIRSQRMARLWHRGNVLPQPIARTPLSLKNIFNRINSR